MKWNILYFDDLEQNIESLADVLQDDFSFIGCTKPLEYQLVLNSRPHAILIDIHMPDLNGFELYQKILQHPHYNECPVFFISGDSTDENKIKSFQNGAVDFFPRGTGWEELKVRLLNKIKLYSQVTSSLEIGNLKIDAKNFRTLINGSQVELTMLEMRILSLIIRTYPEVLTRDHLIEKIWGSEIIKPGTINTHITNLKSKIDRWNHSIKIKDNNILLIKDQ